MGYTLCGIYTSVHKPVCTVHIHFIYYTKLKNRFSSGRFLASALADSKLKNIKKKGKRK